MDKFHNYQTRAALRFKKSTELLLATKRALCHRDSSHDLTDTLNVLSESTQTPNLPIFTRLHT